MNTSTKIDNSINTPKLELKHLSPYLPYGVRFIGHRKNYVHADDSIMILCAVDLDGRFENIKPILRPLLKETLNELFKEFAEFEILHFSETGIKIQYNLLGDYFDVWIKSSGNFQNCPKWIIDLFNENHIDYNGLIEKGLAIDKNKLTN